MAKRGRKPKAEKTAVPLVEPLQVAPPAPKTLGDHGRSCWERLAPLLVELRMLTALHLETFEALCDWWDVYQANKIYLQQHPDEEIFETTSGYQQRSPYAVARNEAYENFVKLCPRFGLTPEALKKINRIGSPARGTPTADDPASAIGKFAAGKYSDDD